MSPTCREVTSNRYICFACIVLSLTMLFSVKFTTLRTLEIELHRACGENSRSPQATENENNRSAKISASRIKLGILDTLLENSP